MLVVSGDERGRSDADAHLCRTRIALVSVLRRRQADVAARVRPQRGAETRGHARPSRSGWRVVSWYAPVFIVTLAPIHTGTHLLKETTPPPPILLVRSRKLSTFSRFLWSQRRSDSRRCTHTHTYTHTHTHAHTHSPPASAFCGHAQSSSGLAASPSAHLYGASLQICFRCSIVINNPQSCPLDLCSSGESLLAGNCRIYETGAHHYPGGGTQLCFGFQKCRLCHSIARFAFARDKMSTAQAVRLHHVAMAAMRSTLRVAKGTDTSKVMLRVNDFRLRLRMCTFGLSRLCRPNRWFLDGTCLALSFWERS